MNLKELKKQIKTEVLDGMSAEQLSDRSLYEKIDGILFSYEGLRLKERLYLRDAVFNSFRRLDLLSELLDDPSITEIMINGSQNIFVEREGRTARWTHGFESAEQLEELIQQIVSRINRVVNTRSPIVDARLEDGSRVHVVLPPVSREATVTIRKFPEPITMERLIAYESLTEEAAEFLKGLVRNAYNIFISGGTNSGKTTFLNALSQFIPEEERVITIEDSAELQLRGIPNLVRLETRNANAEGEGEVGISTLIRASLRMSPNRIIVGEVRGGECLDLLNVLNTGHSGSLSTGHANSGRDALSRMLVMVLQSGADIPVEAIRGMIASAVQVIVHLGRTKDHRRRVLEILEITGMEDGEIQTNCIFAYNGTRLEKVGALENTRGFSH